MLQNNMTTEAAASVSRKRILDAAAALIRKDGPDAATTRAVATAASVQPPTIYRLFGDKEALLDAVAEHELAAYVAAKRKAKPNPDPVEALRQGWDQHVAFGLANPGLFRIMSANPRSPAALAGLAALRERVHAIAVAGRLRGSEERAVAMGHAACLGVVLSLLADGEAGARRDLSAEMRDAMIATITTNTVNSDADGLRGAATTLRARLGKAAALTKGEHGLLDELLLRLSRGR